MFRNFPRKANVNGYGTWPQLPWCFAWNFELGERSIAQGCKTSGCQLSKQYKKAHLLSSHNYYSFACTLFCFDNWLQTHPKSLFLQCKKAIILKGFIILSSWYNLMLASLLTDAWAGWISCVSCKCDVFLCPRPIGDHPFTQFNYFGGSTLFFNILCI